MWNGKCIDGDLMQKVFPIFQDERDLIIITQALELVVKSGTNLFQERKKTNFDFQRTHVVINVSSNGTLLFQVVPGTQRHDPEPQKEPQLRKPQRSHPRPCFEQQEKAGEKAEKRLMHDSSAFSLTIHVKDGLFGLVAVAEKQP